MESVNNFDLLKEITPKMVKNYYNAKRASIFFFDSPKKVLYAGLMKPLECGGVFFVENNNGNPVLLEKLFCLHVKKRLVTTTDIFYYENMENMETIYRKLNDFVFSSKKDFVFPFPTDKSSLFSEEIRLVVEDFKSFE